MIKYILIILLCPLFLMSQTKNYNDIFYDYKSGIDKAKEYDMPIFLLFISKSCKNNDNMKTLLATERVKKELENFVQIHLYVDDPELLERPYKATIDGNELTISTLGAKWGELEYFRYKSNVQPLIIVIDHDKKIVGGPKKYRSISFGLHMFLMEAAIMHKTKQY